MDYLTNDDYLFSRCQPFVGLNTIRYKRAIDRVMVGHLLGFQWSFNRIRFNWDLDDLKNRINPQTPPIPRQECWDQWYPQVCQTQDDRIDRGNLWVFLWVVFRRDGFPKIFDRFSKICSQAADSPDAKQQDDDSQDDEQFSWTKMDWHGDSFFFVIIIEQIRVPGRV